MDHLNDLSSEYHYIPLSLQVVHYEDFERAVYPFLREKILESQKISEAILHNTFKVGTHNWTAYFL